MEISTTSKHLREFLETSLNRLPNSADDRTQVICFEAENYFGSSNVMVAATEEMSAGNHFAVMDDFYFTEMNLTQDSAPITLDARALLDILRSVKDDVTVTLSQGRMLANGVSSGASPGHSWEGFNQPDSPDGFQAGKPYLLRAGSLRESAQRILDEMTGGTLRLDYGNEGFQAVFDVDDKVSRVDFPSVGRDPKKFSGSAHMTRDSLSHLVRCLENSAPQGGHDWHMGVRKRHHGGAGG